jgi:hypothetical protein
MLQVCSESQTLVDDGPQTCEGFKRCEDFGSCLKICNNAYCSEEVGYGQLLYRRRSDLLGIDAMMVMVRSYFPLLIVEMKFKVPRSSPDHIMIWG